MENGSISFSLNYILELKQIFSYVFKICIIYIALCSLKLQLMACKLRKFTACHLKCSLCIVKICR